jgi:lysophospholipase L1-like esterase
MRARDVLVSGIVAVVSVAVSLAAAEVLLRVKNSSMRNYDIEMWRYAKELKVKSPDEALDFDHVPSRSALLQNVNIRLNNWGLRGPDLGQRLPNERRILFLGGSITLGWGVPEEKTVEARLENMLNAAGEQATVLNGGVGNYNSERYVNRFLKELTGSEPTDIVVQYFLRDAEDLPPGGANAVLRNSQLAVTLWIAFHRLFDRQGEASLVEHYRNVYEPGSPGFQRMKRELARLGDYASAHGIMTYLAMTPDVHNLTDYKLGFVHDIMRGIANEYGYAYVDLLPPLLGRSPQELWAMPGDPHPNALGHELMAQAIFPAVTLKSQAEHRE